MYCAVVWQRVIGVVCVLCAVLSAVTLNTAHMVTNYCPTTCCRNAVWCDQYVLIRLRSAYHLYIREEINCRLTAVNDGCHSVLRYVHSLMLRYVKIKM